MRIAFVTQPWDQIVPSADSGSSISIITYQFAHQLADSNEVIIYGKQGINQERVERDANGIEYRRIPTKLESWLLKPVKALDRLAGFRDPKRPLFASRWYYLGYAYQVANDLKKKQCDIVHVCNFSQFIPIIKSLNPAIKIVLHMQCEWLSQIDPAIIEPRLESSDMILGCSEYIISKVRQGFPAFVDRCHAVYNGVDVNHFICAQPAARNPKKLLFVARVSPEKGVHVLLNAFEEVVKLYPDVDLDIVGPAGLVPYEFVLQLSDDDKVSKLASFYGNRIKAGGIDYLAYLKEHLSPEVIDKVSFLGYVVHSRLADLYRNTDVFVFPSVWDEPFGMPIVEAMATEVPVVATRGGGITEIIEDGKTGVLVERGNAAELAKAILTLLQDDQLREKMGKAARQRAVEYFSWEQTSAKLLMLFESLQAQ